MPISFKYMCTGSAAEPRKPSASEYPLDAGDRRGARSRFAVRPLAAAPFRSEALVRRAGDRPVGSSATILAGGISPVVLVSPGRSAASSRPSESPSVTGPVTGTTVVSPAS